MTQKNETNVLVGGLFAYIFKPLNSKKQQSFSQKLFGRFFFGSWIYDYLSFLVGLIDVHQNFGEQNGTN